MINQKTQELRKEIERVNNDIFEAKTKRNALDLKEKDLLKEKAEIDRQTKLNEKRANTKAKNEVIKGFVKSFPRGISFISQTKFFDKVYNNWIEAQKNQELEYKDEMELITRIAQQYKSCMGILESYFKGDQIYFRFELVKWQKSVEKRIKKLEKG